MRNGLAYQRPDTIPAIDLINAGTSSQIAAAADLMRAFVDWQHVRHADHRERLDAYFDPDGFERELARLPQPFEWPGGRLLLAYVDGEAAGVIGLKPLEGLCCEMKRLFVKPEFHGLGLGRLLASRLIEEAAEIGYTAMRLETGPLQNEAQGLYAAMEFRRISPYRQLPDCLRDWLICMERPLGASIFSAPFAEPQIASFA
jgi:GNAT superfamily N-acetyltransferase